MKLPPTTPEQSEHLEKLLGRKRGPMEILCQEIDFHFDIRMETTAMLVAFVKVLVSQVDEDRHMQRHLAHLTGKPPTEATDEAFNLTHLMLGQTEPEGLKKHAAEVHAFCDHANPEDAYPTNHMIDMLSSCASAIRFALEIPCHSRHAAAAANHIWKHRYGVRLFDQYTSAWQHDWTRQMLHRAMLLQIPTS